MLKESRFKGECIGWERATKLMLSREVAIRRTHQKEIKNVNQYIQEKISLGEVAHLKEIADLRVKNQLQQNNLITSQKNEMVEYDKLYNERCKRNDMIRKEAIDLADQAKYKAQQAEDYWNKQSVKINDFIAQATGVVGVVSSRYKDAQLRMSEMSSGEDMIKNLTKILENISKNAHNHSPKMVNGSG